jgi:flavin reductase (DIM6/NTAB) family NADH-FMN oxidoreductase RutF
VDEDGRPNVITLAEVAHPCIANPTMMMLAIAPKRYSNGLIRKTGEFVVNFPTADLVEKVDGCGCVSGREVDKFERFGLTPIPASHVKPPLIKECPVNVECVLKSVQPIGYHDFFMGEVVAIHIDEEMLDRNGNIVPERLNPLVFVLGEYWSVGERLGRYGFSRRKG